MCPIPFICDYSISMFCFITWKHSCSFSEMSRQLCCYWSLFHFLPSLSLHLSSSLPFLWLQPLPPNYPFHLLPFTLSALLSVFSFRLHLHWYHPAVLSSISPFLDPHSFQNCSSFHFLKTPQFCTFFSCSLSPGQSQQGTHRLVVLRSTHPDHKTQAVKWLLHKNTSVMKNKPRV